MARVFSKSQKLVHVRNDKLIFGQWKPHLKKKKKNKDLESDLKRLRLYDIITVLLCKDELRCNSVFERPSNLIAPVEVQDAIPHELKVNKTNIQDCSLHSRSRHRNAKKHSPGVNFRLEPVL